MSKKTSIWAVVFLLILTPSLRAQFNLLHTFGGFPTDGEFPWGSLTINGSTLYGMTYAGGASDGGAVFKINVNGTGFQVLHSFAGGASDGQYPYGSLLIYGSTLYGMTYGGGAIDFGTIFKMNVNGTGFQVLHSFAGGASDGKWPYGSLTMVGTSLFGMTYAGGTADTGTIFKIKLNGAGFAVLHSFVGGSDGAYPHGSLEYVGTKLYGMTSNGGMADLGTLFRFSPSGTGYVVLHSFVGGALDGSYPYFGSLVASNSVLYGTTHNGGSSDRGVVFRINRSGTGLAVLHSFVGGASDGSYPDCSLVLGGTKLYGLTEVGGPGNFGVMFKISTSGTGFEVLHPFARGTTDGAYPIGPLIRKVSTSHGDMLYGMTNYGGPSDFGTIFSYKIIE